VPGVSIKMAKAAAVVRSAVMQHSNNAWLTGSGVAPVDPVRTRPRHNHLRQLGLGGTKPATSQHSPNPSDGFAFVPLRTAWAHTALVSVEPIMPE